MILEILDNQGMSKNNSIASINGYECIDQPFVLGIL